MRRWCLLLCALLLPLLAVSCRRPDTPAVGEASHVRIEPSRAQGDPLRDQPTTGVATAEEVGIAYYPDARVVTSSLMRDGRGVTAAVKLTTRDPYDDVTSFYLNKYGQDSKIVRLDDANGRSVAINWRTASATFTVDVKQDLAGKQTLVHLLRLTGAKDAPRPARR